MLILASSSPRRKELLQSLGLLFEVDVRPVKEDVATVTDPGAVVKMLALRKAQAVAAHHQGGLVIGADTMVVKDGLMLGKPRDRSQAHQMLQKIQGAAHHVYSGVAVVNALDGSYTVDYRRTKVFLQPISDDDIARYLATGEPMDKAGAYAIQGIAAIFVEKISGCYFNVVGLPLNCLAGLLNEMGYPVLKNIRSV